jgi:hypothetical protein
MELRRTTLAAVVKAVTAEAAVLAVLEVAVTLALALAQVETAHLTLVAEAAQ